MHLWDIAMPQKNWTQETNVLSEFYTRRLVILVTSFLESK